MFSNPLADLYLGQVARTVGPLLAVALVGLGVFERRRGLNLSESVLLRRWAVWAVIAVVYTAAILLGEVGALLLFGGLALAGSAEYATLAGLGRSYRLALYIGSIGIPFAALLGPAVMPWTGAAGLLLCSPIPVLRQDVEDGARQLGALALGLVYLPMTLGCGVLIAAQHPGDTGILLVVALAVGLSDVGAFIAGSSLGRRTLCPVLSPKKTWEGVAGNLAGAAVGVAVMGTALPSDFGDWQRLALVGMVALGAVWGDLLESLIKRNAGAKDAGTWLPGFGGLLDRIDSLLVVLPLTYALSVLGR